MGRSGRYNDFLIIGAGIFGVCTAIELCKKGFNVGIINPDTVPHPLAASTDISKIIRMEYGSDGEYMDMAIASMQAWRSLNSILKEEIYHEVGYLVLSRNPLNDQSTYAGSSLIQLKSRGKNPEILSQDELSRLFPAINSSSYTGGFLHREGGYANSGRAVELLLAYAESLGVESIIGEEVIKIQTSGNKAIGICSSSGRRINAGHTIICAGNHTPYLIPELKKYMKVTGHPVFHLMPSNPDLINQQLSAVFAADISNSGWYGFPLHPLHKVVKIANHGIGLELDPRTDERVVTEYDKNDLREFLRESIPSLAKDEIVYTRRCCYTDTLDGHFWIDNHPEIRNLTIGSGGSGHGFKMGPEVGKMIASKALGQAHKWSGRYEWRDLNSNTIQEEEARNTSV